MNHIKISYSYFSHKTEVNMNGEKISPYSEVTATLNRPFLEAVPHIIHQLDDEIFDDYEIDLYATRFQYELLLNMAEQSDYCKAIYFHKIETLIPKETVIDRLSNICSQHGISVKKNFLINVYSTNASISIPLIPEFSRIDTPNADIGIFNDLESIPPTIRTPLILSSSFGIQTNAGHIYYCIPKEQLDLFWEYYEYEFIFLPTITEYMTALRYTKLSDVEKTELDAMKNNQPAYYIIDVPSSVDQGDSFSIEFTSFPSHFFTLKSENSNIIGCKDNTFIANNPGTTNLIITDNKGTSVASKSINVIEHKYAEEIRLIPRFEYLKRSERNRIDVIITPPNAEDANKLVWYISDPNIIQVDESGNIIALEHGKSIICVSGHNISTTLAVEVKPALQGLHFSQQSIRLKNGEMTILDCHLTPEDAAIENLTWELDNKTIASINPSKNGKRCQIIASTNYEGKGNIRCYDSDTKFGAICNIEVISKVKQSTAGKIALVCCLLGIFIPFLLPVSTIASAYGLLCDSELEHHTRYKICAIGSIAILLFWIMAGM